MELGDTDLSSLIKTNSVEKDLYFTLYYWRQMLTAVNHIHKNGNEAFRTIRNVYDKMLYKFNNFKIK